MKEQILVVGDCNLDLIIHGASGFPPMGKEQFVDDISIRVGGSAANVALSLGRLGVPTTLLSGNPTDYLSGLIRQVVDEVGVTLACPDTMQQTSARTGLSISVSTGEDRAFLSYMGSNDRLDTSGITEEFLHQFSHVHLSAFAPERLMDQYAELAQKARAAGCTISLDLGWTDALLEQKKPLWQLLQQVDVFFPNLHEATRITGCDTMEASAAALRKAVRDTVVITNGSHGATAYGTTGQAFCLYPVKAVDSVGTGDAFDAGFLFGYVQGHTLKQCTQFGAACGSFVAQRIGGGASGPTAAEVYTLIQQHEERWSQ